MKLALLCVLQSLGRPAWVFSSWGNRRFGESNAGFSAMNGRPEPERYLIRSWDLALVAGQVRAVRIDHRDHVAADTGRIVHVLHNGPSEVAVDPRDIGEAG